MKNPLEPTIREEIEYYGFFCSFLFILQYTIFLLTISLLIAALIYGTVYGSLYIMYFYEHFVDIKCG